MEDRSLKKDQFCPLNGKVCSSGVREDFDSEKVKSGLKCRWWEHLYGKDPQTEKMIDQWDCSLAWMPIMLAENSQMSRFTATSVDKVANQLNETKSAFMMMSKGLRNMAVEFKNLNENVKKLPTESTIELPPNGNGDNEVE